MFIPFKAEVEILVKPVSNLFIIGVTFIFFISVYSGFTSIDSYILDGFNASLFSHGFMHGSWGHILGNMFYLLLFGSAICSRLGNATFPTIYFTLIITSGAIHLIFDGSPAIGASGAVNGVIGIYLFLYPRSKISCMWTVIWAWGETFTISAYWLIGLWFLKDLFGAIYSNAPIAFVAHLGGLFSGVVIGWFMYKNNWVKRTSKEPNLAQLLSGR